MQLRAITILLTVAILAPLTVAQEANVTLSQTTVDGSTLAVLLKTREDHSKILVLAIGDAKRSQSFNLTSLPLEKQREQQSAPPQLLARAAGNELVAGFEFESENGEKRWIATWLHKNAERWSLCGEWCVEKFEHKEQGEHDERQAFDFLPDGTLRRAIVRNNTDGIQTTCPAGCCKIWQTRTVNTQELETYALDASSGLAQRATVRKWYLAQANDGLFGIAAKVYGNAGKVGALISLNPELQKKESLAEGDRVLFETFPRAGERDLSPRR